MQRNQGRGQRLSGGRPGYPHLFIESCKAQAGGSIFADTILNSFVECAQRISVYGKHGYLLGGISKAGQSVSAGQIGNEANTPTSVVLGLPTGQSEEEQRRSAEAARCYEAMDRLWGLAEAESCAEQPGLNFPVELARISVLSQRLEQRVGQLQRGGAQPGASCGPHRAIQALEALYPNVSLEIDGVFDRNTRRRGRCTVWKRQRELRFTEERR